MSSKLYTYDINIEDINNYNAWSQSIIIFEQTLDTNNFFSLWSTLFNIRYVLIIILHFSCTKVWRNLTFFISRLFYLQISYVLNNNTLIVELYVQRNIPFSDHHVFYHKCFVFGWRWNDLVNILRVKIVIFLRNLQSCHKLRRIISFRIKWLHEVLLKIIHFLLHV